MINALEVVIQYLKQAGLSTTQIASKHRFGESWPVGSQALVVNLDGGLPEIYIQVQRPRLEVRAYGQDQHAALTLLGEVMALSRTTAREKVVISGMRPALLYWLLPESEASTLYDPDAGSDFILMFFTAQVGEDVIPGG